MNAIDVDASVSTANRLILNVVVEEARTPPRCGWLRPADCCKVGWDGSKELLVATNEMLMG
jgi:hypothetical protein